MRGCSAIKQNGEHCKGISATGSDYCPAHDPARAEDRRKAGSKAAKSRHDPEIRRIKGLLQDLYAKVLQGEVGRQAAAVANQIANTQLRAIEIERRVRDQDELEDRLDELEDLLEEAEGSRSYARW
jgi:hypothetical protein